MATALGWGWRACEVVADRMGLASRLVGAGRPGGLPTRSAVTRRLYRRTLMGAGGQTARGDRPGSDRQAPGPPRTVCQHGVCLAIGRGACPEHPDEWWDLSYSVRVSVPFARPSGNF